MSCPTCRDFRWVSDHPRHNGRGPCPHCNDNGQRPLDDPDPSLADIVAALPKGHAARAEYRRLTKAAAK